MRIQHDNGCLWWKDWHSCSCGYLEEEIRNERIGLYTPYIPLQITPPDKIFSTDKVVQECLDIIPGTFIMCGEGVGSERQYCSTSCWEKAKNEQT